MKQITLTLDFSLINIVYFMRGSSSNCVVAQAINAQINTISKKTGCEFHKCSVFPSKNRNKGFVIFYFHNKPAIRFCLPEKLNNIAMNFDSYLLSKREAQTLGKVKVTFKRSKIGAF